MQTITHPVFVELVKSGVITQIEARPLAAKWYARMYVNGQPRELISKRNSIRRFANPATLIKYAKEVGIRRVIFEVI